MAERKRALGRGLSALLQDSDHGQREIDVADIAPNPGQPRREMDEASLAELAASIREHGVIQPIVVTPSPTGDGGQRYQLVAGERRLRAARLAGLSTIPALVRQLDARGSLEVALIENLQRQDLNPIDEAMAYDSLVSGFDLTQEEVARRVGKSRSAVANSLRLLKLPEGVLAMVRRGQLSEGHARALLSLPSPDLIARLAQEVVERGLSVRQTEALAARAQGAAESPRPAARRPAAAPQYEAIEGQLRGRLGTKVVLQRGRKGGRLVIHFYSDEELDAIYHAILGEDTD